MSIKTQLQNTDIYIIDQILKGRFESIKSILDVGCGSGRNLTYFLQNDFNVYGLDPNEIRLIEAQQLALKLNPSTPLSNFRFGIAEQIPFEQHFDLVICNAVFHFSNNQ